MTDWVKQTVTTYSQWNYNDKRTVELWMKEPPKPVHECDKPYEYMENPNEGSGPELVRLKWRTYWKCDECGEWWWLDPAGGPLDRPRWWSAPERRYRFFSSRSNQAFDDIKELKKLDSQEET